MFFNLAKRIGALAIVCLLSACVGKNFERPAMASLKIGEMTMNDAIVRFGQPQGKKNDSINGMTVENISYVFAGPASGPGTMIFSPLLGSNTVASARILGLSFHNEILVGYQFTSSFKNDHTDFDESKRSQISNGDDCAEIEDLFGPAPGKFVFPMAKEEGHLKYVYVITIQRKEFLAMKHFSKKLTIHCNASDKISEISYVEGDM